MSKPKTKKIERRNEDRKKCEVCGEPCEYRTGCSECGKMVCDQCLHSEPACGRSNFDLQRKIRELEVQKAHPVAILFRKLQLQKVREEGID